MPPKTLTDNLSGTGADSNALRSDFERNFAPNTSTIMGAYDASKKTLQEGYGTARDLTTSQYGTKIEDAQALGKREVGTAKESQRGFATNTAYMKMVQETGEKRVTGLKKDMEELLMMNKVDEASKLSDLVLKEQEAMTRARTLALDEYFGFKGEARAQDTATLDKAKFGLQEQGLAQDIKSSDRSFGLDQSKFGLDQQKFDESQRQFGLNYGLSKEEMAQKKLESDRTFEENKRQFGLDYAISKRNSDADVAYKNAQTRKTLMDIKDLGGNQITYKDGSGVEKTANVSSLTKAIMDGTGSLKDLTSTDKAKVISEMSALGYNPKQNLVNRMQSLLNLWEAVPADYKGPVKGRLYGIGGYGANIEPTIGTFESARIPLTREIARLYDVGMLSDQDVADYKSAMPSLADKTREAAAAKLTGLTTAMIPGKSLNDINYTGGNTTSSGVEYKIKK